MPATAIVRICVSAVREASTTSAAATASEARAAIRSEAPRHAPDRLRHDGDRHDLEAVEPPGLGEADGLQPVGERDERDRRGQGESQPRGESAEQAGAQDADRHADLTAGRAGQELAERDEIGVLRFVDPAPPHDVLVAEVAEVRDRSAERGEAQTHRGAQHFEEGSAAIAQ